MAIGKATVESAHPAYMDMLVAWELVDDLMGGTAAMKAAEEKWLPREEGESRKWAIGRYRVDLSIGTKR